MSPPLPGLVLPLGVWELSGSQLVVFLGGIYIRSRIFIAAEGGLLEPILYRVDIQDMLVKRPRRYDDLHSYYDLDMFIIIYIYFVHDYSVYIYILLVFKYAFYMVFCAA